MKERESLSKKRRKKNKWKVVILSWLGVIAALVLVVVCCVAVLRVVGRNRLRNNTNTSAPNLQLAESSSESTGENPAESAEGTQSTEPEEEEVVWKEGWVRHNGKIYEYNDDIMTFLMMGIDKDEEVTENPDAVSGGQSDALFLVVLDTAAKEGKLVAINRDTIVDIKIYNVHAEGYEQTVQAQITTQHGFGDGKEQSCELTRDAVSDLFFGLPIHGYVSINMAAIPELNDAVGGVDLTVLEDLTKKNSKWKEGTQVHLEGMDSFWYVKYRDITIFESARGRLARQKQYLQAYIAKMIEAVKNDITLPITLYSKLSKYMVTDISIDEVTYLTSELLNYHIDLDNIYTMEGTTKVTELTEHEEFYPDYDALRDLMIEVFYREVQL